MTIQTRTVIRPTRRVRDLLRRRKFTIVARFPGGREIERGHAETRQRAFKQALYANRAQTSPTAAAGGQSYIPDAQDPMSYWKRLALREDPLFY